MIEYQACSNCPDVYISGSFENFENPKRNGLYYSFSDAVACASNWTGILLFNFNNGNTTAVCKVVLMSLFVNFEQISHIPSKQDWVIVMLVRCNFELCIYVKSVGQKETVFYPIIQLKDNVAIQCMLS